MVCSKYSSRKNVSVSNITINGGAANVQNEMVGEFNDPTATVGLTNG